MSHKPVVPLMVSWDLQLDRDWIIWDPWKLYPMSQKNMQRSPRDTASQAPASTSLQAGSTEELLAHLPASRRWGSSSMCTSSMGLPAQEAAVQLLCPTSLLEAPHTNWVLALTWINSTAFSPKSETMMAFAGSDTSRVGNKWISCSPRTATYMGRDGTHGVPSDDILIPTPPDPGTYPTASPVCMWCSAVVVISPVSGSTLAMIAWAEVWCPGRHTTVHNSSYRSPSHDATLSGGSPTMMLATSPSPSH
mmetsp:Transcript_93937/g.251430  ORF Transcript_93937/g.251430 Transcript_93937/m.251430 type:complete len:249 (-) Transcript_93937:1334-2080(-)